jgi:Tfp pilus assembly protein FimT
MDICHARQSDPMIGKSQSLRRFIRKSEAGYQMVELLVLLAVMSVILAIGFPMYLTYARAQETDGAARTIVVALNHARSLAVTRGTSYTVTSQTHPNNRMRSSCVADATWCPTPIYTGPGTDGSGWRTLENGARITLGPAITFNSVGAATASGVIRVSNSTATGSLDVCVNPSGKIRVQAVGAACP